MKLGQGKNIEQAQLLGEGNRFKFFAGIIKEQ